MPETIINNILSPKYQREYNFSNLDEKVRMCREIKRLEEEISTQLDRVHKRLFWKYAEDWDKLHAELILDAFANGLNENKG